MKRILTLACALAAVLASRAAAQEYPTQTIKLISSFGDRIHQVALAFLVLGATNSPAAVGLVFLAATLPNLLLGPISGTFVDRWSQKQVMVVSDLLRASIVLSIPLAAVTNIALVYPLVFLVTSISIFFRVRVLAGDGRSLTR